MIFTTSLFFLPSIGSASLSIWNFPDKFPEKNNPDPVEKGISILLEELEGERQDKIEEEPISQERIDFHEEKITFPEKPVPLLVKPVKPRKPTKKRVTYDFPIEINSHVEKYLDFFQTRLRPHFEKWLARSGRYVKMMKQVLRAHMIPEDLVYLSMIESGFNPKAFSRSRASGPWQFIKSTGKNYDLRIDRWIDERRDPLKSTMAAARYLSDLYDMFGSWPLALAAYNGGEGRVSRAIARTKTKEFWKLINSKRLFKQETRGYVPKYMAATIIAKDPSRFQFDIDYHSQWKYDEVKVQKGTYLSTIAEAAKISIEEVREYNPELKRSFTPPDLSDYRIKLPVGKKAVFLENYIPGKNRTVPFNRSFKHRVRRGETITSIARDYGVKVSELLEINDLGSRSIIHPGQYILVSDGWSREERGSHRIRRGDTVGTIARKYNVPMQLLLDTNQLHEKSIIRVGDSLFIPEIRKHRIRRGETIGTIARKYAVRMKDLLTANRLTEKSVIRAGHHLLIP